MSKEPIVVGERLKLARTQRGWTLEALSAHTHISVSTLSEFETGKREPRLIQLERLSQAHGHPVSWFLHAEPAPVNVVLWRERPKADDAAAIEGRFLKMCGWYKNLEEWCDDRRPCLLPEAPGSRESFGWPSVVTLAASVRNQLDLGQRPAFSLLNVLENTCGIRVFHLEFEPTGTAACTRSEEAGMAVLLNSLNTRWRRNFDLAHELFHLLTWRIFRADDAMREATDTEESYADAFASCLLMPEDAVRAAVADASKSGGELKHSELFDIARQFDVSISALLWRIHKVFGRDRTQTLKDIDACNALRRFFDVRESSSPPALPERYRVLALRALKAGQLSVGRAAEYLALSRKEAMALDDGEDLADDAVSLSPA